MRYFVIPIISSMLMSCGYNEWSDDDPRVVESGERWSKYLGEYPAGSKIDNLKSYLEEKDIDFTENEKYLNAELERIKVGVWYKKCNTWRIHLSVTIGPDGSMEAYELRSVAPCF